MKRFSYKYITAAALFVTGALLISCTGDLDVENINPQQTSELNISALFNKMYANMVTTGQTGPDGNGDLDDIDEGTSNMIRQIWNANELTTDESHCVWGDPGIPEFNHNSWTDAHTMMEALYYRLFFGVTLANFFLEQAEGTDAATLTERAEARFMRALYYYYLMDLYANVPIYTTVTSEDVAQSSRSEVFAFIESELKDIIGEGTGDEILADARTNDYGRADKAAGWMLLARLYLNAEVYAGENRYSEAESYAEKVINSGYTLLTDGSGGYTAFQLLFMGDNDSNGAQNEIILPAIHDGDKTQTWGGSLFIIASTNNGDYATGTSESWGGNRARYQFLSKFTASDAAIADMTEPREVAAAIGDDRALFYPAGHTMEIDDESSFKSGYAYIKFLAKRSDGASTSNTQFVDTDFPMMRVAEAYLTYAEADARLNGGACSSAGLSMIKALRSRANANTNITAFTLDQISDEWSREFGYEGLRRTTLVRFGKYGGQSAYKWEWMGGTKAGTSFSSNYNIFAIPSSVISTGGMTQNTGY